jgi:hypothetical protein
MKLHWLFAICGALLAETALAQQLAVRSGDHPTFSRLTIPIPASQIWEARKTERGLSVKLPGVLQGFDTSSVFARMRPDRISGLESGSDTLRLTLACACDATAFRSGSLLVIDVADANTVLAGPPIEAAETTADMRQAAQANAWPRTPSLPWIGGPSPFGPATSSSKRGIHASAEADASSTIEDRAAILREVQTSLIESVANATSAGLLENSLSEPPPVADDEPAPKGIIQPEAQTDATIAPSQNIRITSSLDLPNYSNSSETHSTSSGVACPDNNSLAIETWGNESGFSAQIGPARNALVDARDRLDRSAAKQLAKLYIYFGFGAEALDALALDPTLTKENPQIVALGTILERGAMARPNALAQFAECNSEAALWAVLSYEKIPGGTLVDTDAALRALNNLPKHLRQIVAPALSDRFLSYGDPSAAAAALRSIGRLADPVTHDAMMSEASLALDSGEPAEGFLENVIQDNSTRSPDALVKLVETKLAKNEPLPQETATLVEAYVQELRDTPMGYKLRQTQVIALGQSGAFDDAFRAFEALAPSLSIEAKRELKEALLGQLTKKADDLVFLEHFFALNSAEIKDTLQTTRMALASRLLDLGFAAQVQEILATIDTLPRLKDRQILAARAALSLRQPFQAQAALIGIDGAEASLILAQAKDMAGEYREASEIFTRNNADAQAVRAAWLSEDWQDLTSVETPGLGAAATLVRLSPDVDSSELGPLGQANRALEESSAARNTLELLLNDPAVQISPDS